MNVWCHCQSNGKVTTRWWWWWSRCIFGCIHVKVPPWQKVVSQEIILKSLFRRDGASSRFSAALEFEGDQFASTNKVTNRLLLLLLLVLRLYSCCGNITKVTVGFRWMRDHLILTLSRCFCYWNLPTLCHCDCWCNYICIAVDFIRKLERIHGFIRFFCLRRDPLIEFPNHRGEWWSQSIGNRWYTINTMYENIASR